jgi:hypothetical protein
MMLTALRLLAACVDVFLIASYVISVCVFATEWRLAEPGGLLLPVFATSVPALYFAVLESDRWGGGTIGKRLLDLTVLGPGRVPLSMYRSCIRTAVKLLLPAALVSASLRAIHSGVISVALATLAFVVIPVSICIGRGAIRAGQWAGTVAGADSKLVPGAPVFLWPVTEAARRSLGGAKLVLADASGYYQFGGLPPGDYRVLASFDLSEVDEDILDAARAPVTRLDAGQRMTADLPLWIAP